MFSMWDRLTTGPTFQPSIANEITFIPTPSTITFNSIGVCQMATAPAIATFTKTFDNLEKTDWAKLKRPSLGDESLSDELEPRIQTLKKYQQLFQRYAKFVHDQHLNPAKDNLQQIADSLAAHASRNNSEYIQTKDQFIIQLDNQLESLRTHLAPFVAAAVVERGFLEDEGIRQEYEKTVENLRTETQETLERLNEEANNIIAEAKRLASEIEEKARKTATKVSVKDAQEQFRSARPTLHWAIGFWALVSILSLAAFLWTTWYFMHQGLNGVIDLHTAIYRAILRIVFLSAIGAVATFSLRMLRAHMHMNQLNSHRIRIANSIESFVASAQTPEQRDAILSNLVEAVVAFGNSGLLIGDDDSIGAQKMSAEIAGRAIGTAIAKKS